VILLNCCCNSVELWCKIMRCNSSVQAFCENF